MCPETSAHTIVGAVIIRPAAPVLSLSSAAVVHELLSGVWPRRIDTWAASRAVMWTTCIAVILGAGAAVAAATPGAAVASPGASTDSSLLLERLSVLEARLAVLEGQRTRDGCAAAFPVLAKTISYGGCNRNMIRA